MSELSSLDLRGAALRAGKRVIPERVRAHEAVQRMRARVLPDPAVRVPQQTYQDWMGRHEPALWSPPVVTPAGSAPVSVSIVVPAYNTPDKYLVPLVDSVIDQTYRQWQLVLVDASDDPIRGAAIARQADRDGRITLARNTENQGIAANTNAGLAVATGDYIGFADHDDVLSPHALNEVVTAILQHDRPRLLYSDEDKLSDDGTTRSEPFCKPDFSPTLLEGVNYLAHLVVVERSLVTELGGLREGFDGAQDYDFVLRATAAVDRVHHIAKILYHWRLADGSTAKSAGEKSYADDAGQAALADHVERRQIPADVVGVADRPTNYRLAYHRDDTTLVSVIIPFKDKVDYLRRCVASIVEHTRSADDGRARFELILVSNKSIEAQTHDYLAEVADRPEVTVVHHDHPFNYSAVNNVGRAHASGDCLVFLNNDTEVLTPGWLEDLSSVAMQPDVGAVGPQLLYPDGRIQHAGVILGMDTMAGHPFRFRTAHEPTPFGLASWPRDYLAVTGACLAVAAADFDAVGGFDEEFVVAGSDVALCLRLHESGRRNVYWPFVQLTHFESVSVGSYDNGLIGDYNRSLEYYEPYRDYRDPFWNPNLDLLDDHISLRQDYDRPVAVQPVAATNGLGRLLGRSGLVSKVRNIHRNFGPVGLARRVVNSLVFRIVHLPLVIRQRITPRVISVLAAIPFIPLFKPTVDLEVKRELQLVSNPLFQFSAADLEASHAATDVPLDGVDTINWFIPNFDHLAFGGIYTIFRFLTSFADKGARARIIIFDHPHFDTERLERQIAQEFPGCTNYEIIIFDHGSQDVSDLPACDVAICTFWVSAYLMLRFNKTRRKYYFIQDYEPVFYAGGSTYALAESTYRFGYRGLVNTPGLLAAVNQQHGVEGVSFVPTVDRTLYFPDVDRHNTRVRIFFYARPSNPRNAFSLAVQIIRRLLDRYGRSVEIVVAGADWNEKEFGLGGRITNLGLLGSLREVADLYRSCDIGVVYMLSKHPSYQPFEFMASGMATVTNYNEDNLWLLQHEVNCLLSEPSPEAMTEAVARLVDDIDLRQQIARNGNDYLTHTWDEQTDAIWNEIVDH